MLILYVIYNAVAVITHIINDIKLNGSHICTNASMSPIMLVFVATVINPIIYSINDINVNILPANNAMRAPIVIIFNMILLTVVIYSPFTHK